MSLPDQLIIRLAVALGIGLLIGVERERSKGEGPNREVAGLRTFSLIALSGAVSLLLAAETGMIVLAAILGVLVAVGYSRTRHTDPGLTTEVAMILTFLLGALAMREPQLAAALGVIVAIVLAARSRLHDWVHNVLTDREVHDGLLLAAAALVILPLTPTEAIDPWGILVPRTLWTLAVLVMAINGLGYIVLRAIGARVGLALAGLFSGFVSSTATIGAMGARAKDHPELRHGAVAGAAVSSVATVIQLAIVISLISTQLLRQLSVALIASGLAALIYAGLFTLRSARETPENKGPAGRPFAPATALLFVAVVGATLALSALLNHWLGNSGMLLAAAVSGFGDAHASAISAASLAASGRTTLETAALAILAGVTTNAISKTVVAFTLGDRKFAFELLPGLLLMTAAAWLGFFASRDFVAATG